MPRSAPSVACATCHPAFSAPTRLAAGIATSLRKISQKCESPMALRIGRTSTPGRGHVQQEVRNALALGGIRVGAGQQQAPVGVHTAAGPQLLAVDDVVVAVASGRGAQARQVGAGLRFGEALDPDLAVEDRGQVPSALLVGARDQQGRRGVVDADEGQHQPRRVVGGQFLVEHDLFGDRHAAAPLARPVRHREAGACSSANQAFWNATNSVVARRRSGSRASPAGCARRTSARTLRRGTRLEVGRSRVQTRSGRGRARRGGSVRRAWRTARAAAGAAAGCSGTATTAWSRRRTRPRRAADGRPGRPPRRLRSPTSAAPARRRALRACSVPMLHSAYLARISSPLRSTSASVSWNCTPWNADSGWPNCLRRLT